VGGWRRLHHDELHEVLLE